MKPDERTCPSCGYTKRDQQIHGDHNLCKNAGNAPWEKQSSAERVPSTESREKYVIVADGEGAGAWVIPGGDLKEAVHKFMCCCGKPWEQCATQFVIDDVRRVDDQDAWNTDEDGKPFSISWEYETGYTTLYRLSEPAASPAPTESRAPHAKGCLYSQAYGTGCTCGASPAPGQAASAEELARQIDQMYMQQGDIGPSENRVDWLAALLRSWKGDRQ